MDVPEIVIDAALVTLIAKLRHCQDAKSGDRVFLGTIRVAYRDEIAVLLVEETVYETENGDVINTAMLRS